jgi:hypothetical protein
MMEQALAGKNRSAKNILGVAFETESCKSAFFSTFGPVDCQTRFYQVQKNA